MMQSDIKLNQYIDHTYLKPIGGEDIISRICEEAITYNFFSVCVSPYYVPLAVKKTQGSSVEVCSVVGFPHGINTTTTKQDETRHLVSLGATEIDMVLNVAAFKDKNLSYVEKDIQSVVQAAEGKLVKVIIETCWLDPDEIATASRLCEKAGAHFVKTSTGFGPEGASVENIQIIKANVSDNIGIKASGGVGTAEFARELILAGATRIGASRSVELVKA